MSGVTRVDVEHTKARIAYLRTQLDVCKVHRIIPGDSTVEAAVSIAESLVAAVERVQALHEHVTVNTVSYCRVCLTAYPCLTIQALETS